MFHLVVLDRNLPLGGSLQECSIWWLLTGMFHKIIEDVKMLTYQLWLGMWKNSQLYTNKVLLLEITVV
jgi:hypothetical protein